MHKRGFINLQNEEFSRVRNDLRGTRDQFSDAHSADSWLASASREIFSHSLTHSSSDMES